MSIKNLVIVESPAKAKTIEGYLGDGFVVKSSMGHVRDLIKGDMAIDIAHGFEPKYEVSEGKQELIRELSSLSKKSEVVWLATDDDREGESISWHLKEALDIDDKKIKRIVFREITKNAIKKAIENPRSINTNLVNAQQARRVLDRLVGYEISPVLWKKIKPGLSAGRVQSVAVRLVAEREREIEKFRPEASFKTQGIFKTRAGKALSTDLNRDYKDEEDVNQLMQASAGGTFVVTGKEVKPAKRSPAPPFTTSTLQQEASRKLGFSVTKTMTLAQKLYESGKISYMRTDSTSLSEEALSAAAAQISSEYGDRYAQRRQFKTKSESAQEAHEAIRPTNFAASSVSGERDEQRLYELIWKRAIASQMADAELERTIVTIRENSGAYLKLKDGEKLHYQATGEVIKFDGFLKVYIEDTDAEADEEKEGGDEKLLPFVETGEKLELDQIKSRQRFTRPEARYTEASLVKKLEEMGIGRPSTYAPTVSTIEKREYVTKEWRDGKTREYIELNLKGGQITRHVKTEVYGAEKAKLFPTDVGLIVNDFLTSYFKAIVDYDFTARVEKEFDTIAQGKLVWQDMISKFYQPFHETVESTASIERKEINSAREIGTDPKTGKKVLAKLGRFGPYVQIGEQEEGGPKPAFASLKKDQRIETISIEEALSLFDLPREIGEYENEKMIVNNGRFGPYVKLGAAFYSLQKGQDPYTIDAETAIQLIEAKRKADLEKVIKTFESRPDVKVLNGRFGPYIAVGKDNIKIPKGTEAKDLTLEDCLVLAAAQAEKPPVKKGGGRFGRKK
jgi:DNA topoisomerase-1